MVNKTYSDKQWKKAILNVMYDEPDRAYIQCELLDYAYEWLIRNKIEPEEEEVNE